MKILEHKCYIIFRPGGEVWYPESLESHAQAVEIYFFKLWELAHEFYVVLFMDF